MRYGAIFSALALMLSGCTTLPEMPDDSPEGVNQLADIIECEIITTFRKVADEKEMNFSGWGATFEISQNSTRTDGMDANPVTWLAPAGVTKLLYSANAKYERETYRNGKVKYETYVADGRSKACQRLKNYQHIKVEPRDFKLDEWVSRLARPENYDNLKDFGYSVRIQVTTNAGIGPDFEDGKWTAKGNISRKRVTVKTVDFAFSKHPGKPEPVEVIIVGKKIAPPHAQMEMIVPRRRSVNKPAATSPPSTQLAPSISRQNDLIIQGLQLDRVAPRFPEQ